MRHFITLSAIVLAVTTMTGCGASPSTDNQEATSQHVLTHQEATTKAVSVTDLGTPPSITECAKLTITTIGGNVSFIRHSNHGDETFPKYSAYLPMNATVWLTIVPEPGYQVINIQNDSTDKDSDFTVTNYNGQAVNVIITVAKLTSNG